MSANASHVLQELESQARENNWPIIGPEKGKILAEIIIKYQPKLVLEVGTLVGYSAILMSQHLGKGAKIVTLEINPEIARIGKENFEKAGVEHIIDLKIGDALALIPRLLGLLINLVITKTVRK